MLIKIGKFEYTECWDGVLYKKLSDYPKISEWELQSLSDFIRYEEDQGRECPIEADDKILQRIQEYRSESRQRIQPPERIAECTACPRYRGCMTDLVCHTSSVESAMSILSCGRLQSAVRARNLPASVLKAEARNAANDPEDYFDYVMFAWGNCQAGDRLVTERRLGRFPDEQDLSGDFMPGVRFFFRYENLIHHPDAVFDGVLPLKIRNEVILRDWIHAIVIPESERSRLCSIVPSELSDHVYYLGHDGCDIWQWSEKVYEFARNL